MKKYYRVTTGCSKCAEKGYFPLDTEEHEKWQCPYQDPHCTAKSLQHERWTYVHKGKLLAIGAAGIVLLLTVLIASGAKKRELARDLNALQSKVTSWRKEVTGAPQNKGLGSIPERIKTAGYDRKKEASGGHPGEAVTGLNNLEELLEDLRGELAAAKKEVVPDFEKPPPLPVYKELRISGQGHLSTENRLRRRARHLRQERHTKTLGAIKQKIQSGLTNLREKSEPPPDTIRPNIKKAKQAYEDALAEAIKRVEDAIERIVLAPPPPPPPPKQPKQPSEWEESKVLIHVSSSPALSKSLVEKLIFNYIKERNDGKDPKVLAHPEKGEAILKYAWSKDGKTFAIGVGTTANDPSSEILFRMLPDGPAGTSPKVIALDAMIALVHPSRDLKEISEKNLLGVIDGTIATWDQLGDGSGKVKLTVPAPGSGGSLALPPRALENPAAIKLPDGEKITSAITPAAIGLTSYHQRPSLPPLAVGQPGIAPKPFTISTEDYRFSRRVYAHAASNPGNQVKDFLQYILSSAGQKVVANANYVDLRIRKLGTPLPAEAMPYIGSILGNDKIVQACRLSTNFRFALDSDQLDLKAYGDVKRVQEILMRPSSAKFKCLVVGFADSQGTDEYNRGLSEKRARAVSARLEAASGIIPPTYRMGLGEMLPVADNESEAGRAKNRRVEIWLVETL